MILLVLTAYNALDSADFFLDFPIQVFDFAFDFQTAVLDYFPRDFLDGTFNLVNQTFNLWGQTGITPTNINIRITRTRVPRETTRPL